MGSWARFGVRTQLHRRIWWRVLVDSAAVATVVGGCTLFCIAFLSPDHVATVSSVYLVAVLTSTLRGGFWTGLLAATLSFLAMDYYFIPPLQLIDLSQLTDWLAALAFFGIVLVVSQLVQRAQSEAAEARRREYVARLIAGLAQAVVVKNVMPDLLGSVVHWACFNLPARGCRIYLASSNNDLGVVAQAGHDYGNQEAERSDARTAVVTGSAIRTIGSATSMSSFPLSDGTHSIGALQIIGEAPLPWILGEDQFWYTVTRQIAIAIERARLQSEANEAEVLHRSDELKSTLLSLVGHELQTPLTVIKTASTGLRESWDHHDRRTMDTLTGVIERETDRLHHFLRNLLDLSRIEGGALRLNLDWYDLGELIRESLDRLQPVVGEQLVEVVVDENAPPVHVDYLLIDRVIANLILNAVRYAPSEQPIRVQVVSDGSWICMRVVDHGPGVPEADLYRMFERFYRRDGVGVGAGLGLALCKRIVEAHGGHIWAEPPNDDSTGLEVAVTFPASLPGGEPALLRGLESGAVV